MPASNPRALEKAKSLECDAIIFDLEDAVAPDAKPEARLAACTAVSSGEYGYRELIVRVNGMDSEWHDDDLAAVCAAGPDAIAVPKIDSPEQVRQLVATFDRLGADPKMELWAMIETPRAIEQVDAICAASERLSVVVMGTNDLLNELRARAVPSRRPLQFALSATVCAARANGRVVLDGVFNDVRDIGGFEQECVDGMVLGFDGKTLIHPGQVGIANRVWSPGAEEVNEARELIDTFDRALARGEGVVTFHGKMIENLHVDNARRVLAMDEVVRAR